MQKLMLPCRDRAGSPRLGTYWDSDYKWSKAWVWDSTGSDKWQQEDRGRRQCRDFLPKWATETLKLVYKGASVEQVCDNQAGQLHLRYKACEVANRRSQQWMGDPDACNSKDIYRVECKWLGVFVELKQPSFSECPSHHPGLLWVLGCAWS